MKSELEINEVSVLANGKIIVVGVVHGDLLLSGRVGRANQLEVQVVSIGLVKQSREALHNQLIQLRLIAGDLNLLKKGSRIIFE